MMRLVNFLGAAERAVIIGLSLATLLMIFADIVGRELIGGGIYWASRFGVYGFIFIALLGLPLATERALHIRPQVLERVLAAAPEHVRMLLEHGIAALINGALGGICLLYVLSSVRLAECDPVTGVPLWTILLALPYGFFSTTLRHLCLMGFKS
jgi:TRAP-type C4-dicarboxylate transport system permease small subunit